jgi:hypothetical protein
VLEATADQAICLRLDVEDLRLCWECGLRLLLDPLLRHFRAESGESRVESQKGIAESERPGNSPALDSPPSALDSLGIDGRGGLNAAVITDAKSERVVVHFGRKPLTWIGMKPSEARAFAEMLLAAAIELETAPLVADILAEEATKDEGQRTKDET